MSKRRYSERDIARDLAGSIVEGLLVLPIGAGVHALWGWWGVLFYSLGWVLAGVLRAAFRYRTRLAR